MTAADESGDAAEVAAYLSSHPDFFQDHLFLLESLRLPHESGTAVSLVARQIDVLREKMSDFSSNWMILFRSREKTMRSTNAFIN